MRKYLSKVVVGGLIPILSMAAILCCNFSKLVEASTVAPQKAVPACHAPKGKAAAPAKAKCECCVSKLQADVLTKVSLFSPQVVSGYLSFNGLHLLNVITETQFQLVSSNSPPGSTPETPLYIYFHNFRI